jgi:putative transposase
VGPVAVKVPKVRDRSGTGVKFNSAIVPPYVRKSPRVSAALQDIFMIVTRARNCVSRATFLGLAFKLMEEAEKTWRKIRGADKIGALLDGAPFKDGMPAQDNPPGQ